MMLTLTTGIPLSPISADDDIDIYALGMMGVLADFPFATVLIWHATYLFSCPVWIVQFQFHNPHFQFQSVIAGSNTIEGI